jgi:DNA polymerase/3'-5' exonuclease PolX
MSDGPRLPLEAARAVADALVAELSSSCDRIEVGGSIRRCKADVGDVELVAIPRFRVEPDSLWGDVVSTNLLSEQLANLAGLGVLDRLSGGQKYQKLRDTASGMQVDLFITTPDQWGLLMVIRTGPADYSQWLVTEARRRGFHSGGLRLWHGSGHPKGTECMCERTGETPIPTPTEESVYATLGLPYVRPADRVAP